MHAGGGRWISQLIVAVTLGSLLPSSSEAQTATQHFPTNEDLRHTRTVRDAQLSPDGKQVLLSVADSTADGGKSHLWLVDIAGNHGRQITFSGKGDGRGEFAGKWMPDGSAVLFLAKRAETTQLFRLPMQGGEASPYDLKVTPPPAATAVERQDQEGTKKTEDKKTDDKDESLPIDIDDFEVSTDGGWLAVLAKDPQTAAEKKKETDKDDAEFVDHEPRGVRLYLAALDKAGATTGKLTPAEVPPDVQGIAWAPHADRLAVVAEAPNNLGDLHPARSAWLVERSGEAWKTTSLSTVPATVEERTTWSSDEKRLFFLAQTQDDAPPGVSDLYSVELDSQAVKEVSRNFQGGIRRVVTVGADAALAEVSVGTTLTVARFPIAGGKPEVLSFDRPAVGSLATNAVQSGWVYQRGASGAPPAVCFARTLSSPCTVLPVPEAVPAEWRNVTAQVVHWKGGDLTIEGLLYLPPQSEQGKVPLLVDVHGGPTGQFANSYSPFPQFLVGQGWAVLQTNPRGSTGYGAAFAAANKNDLGGGDYQDIMAGVDFVLANFPIDANKMALIGYSYGGEMAGFVEGKTDRFRAIVSGAPVIDQFSEYGTESSSWYDRWFYGKPWEHEQDAWRQSPLSGVAHAKTPFLLLQGQADTTDPAGQSEEMYRALRQAGVPVELVEYPRENHGPLAMGMMGYPSREPWHGFDARKRLVEFIGKQFAAADKK